MADIQITKNIVVNLGNQVFRSSTTQFTSDFDAAEPGGPSPGDILVTPAGVNLDLSQLTNPSICEITNKDAQAGNFVLVGISDGTEFYSLLEVWPGESFPLRLSRFYATSLGSGTGSADTGTYTIHLRSTLANARVTVSAFDR